MKTSTRPTRPGLVLLVLCLAQFMLVLDISVTNVALASIQADLGFHAGDLQWIVTAYTLAFGGLLIFFGRLGDIAGRRRVFMIGLGVFSVASLLCGLAQKPWQLIAARAAQGLGGAMMSPAALSLLTTTFEEGPARNRALGVWGAIAAGGAAAGMIIGGAVTDVASWRWVFFINVPVGLAVVLVAPAVVAESIRNTADRLDVAGAVTVSAGLVALVFGLTRIGEDGLTAPSALGSLIAGAALLVVFMVVERRQAAPLVHFDLFRVRGVSVANTFSLLSTAVVIGQSFFLSLYLRDVLQYSPLRTGFALVPITLVVIAVAAVIPRALPRLGLRTVLVTAAALLAGGMALQARMPADGSYPADVLPGIVVTAAGLGLAFVATTIAATAGVPPQRQGLASGVLNTSQQIGGALGLAALATLAADRTADLLRDGDPPAEALSGGFQVGFWGAVAFAVAAGLAALLAPGRGDVDIPTRAAAPVPT